jgi:hypothetical protein
MSIFVTRNQNYVNSAIAMLAPKNLTTIFTLAVAEQKNVQSAAKTS